MPGSSIDFVTMLRNVNITSSQIVDLIDHDDAAADHTALADLGAARDARHRGHDRMLAEAHVVGDLHEIVELHAVLDDGVLDRAAVHRGVRADLDVVADHDAAELRNLAATRRRPAQSRNRRRRSRQPGCRMQRAPIRTPSSTVTRATEPRARCRR